MTNFLSESIALLRDSIAEKIFFWGLYAKENGEKNLNYAAQFVEK